MKIDKKAVKDLIDRLSDKTLKTGCIVETNRIEGEMVVVYENTYNKGEWRLVQGKSTFYQSEKDMKIIGSPVMIGDVLHALRIHIAPYDRRTSTLISLHAMWYIFGFKKSLNDIMEESGYEEIEKTSLDAQYEQQSCETPLGERIKNRLALDLVRFLLELKL